jgi:hypothetical protein
MPYQVYAVGKHDVFEPYLQSDGTYPLYSTEKQRLTGKPIFHAVNKHEGVTSLPQAIRLVKQNQFRWRLQGRQRGQRSVFAPDSIIVKATL